MLVWMKLLRSPIRLFGAIVALVTLFGCINIFGSSGGGNGGSVDFPRTARVTLVAVNSTDSAVHFVVDPGEPTTGNTVTASSTREVASTDSYQWLTESSTQEITVFIYSSTYLEYPIGSNSIVVSGADSGKKIRAVWDGESVTLSYVSH